MKGALLFSPLPVPLGTGSLSEGGGKVVVDSFRPRNYWLSAASSVQAVLLLLGVLLFAGTGGPAADRSGLTFFFVLAVLLTVAHAVTFPETRYRLSIDVALAPFSAIGLSRFGRRRVAPLSRETDRGETGTGEKPVSNGREALSE